MVELVDMALLESAAERRVGSNPTMVTIGKLNSKSYTSLLRSVFDKSWMEIRASTFRNRKIARVVMALF